MKIYGINQPYLTMLPNKKPSFRASENRVENREPVYHTYPRVELQTISRRPPTRTSTLEKFDKFYDKYKESLNEIPEQFIEDTINSIDAPREKVVETMMGITQFGNINSINTIAEVLKNCDIGLIGALDETTSDNTSNFGLNGTMDYLIRKKRFGKLDRYSTRNAIFLDNNKLAQLEQLKMTDPQELKKITQDKNNFFFILSGYNNGVNFLNISPDILREKTVAALNKRDVDEDTIHRAIELSIDPIVIKNEGKNVYEQLKPNQMSKEELMAVIDANVMLLQKKYKDKIDTKEDIIQYLDNTIEVYTPTKLTKDLQKTYKEIEAFAKSKGKTMDDLIYVIPYLSKSYDYINAQYQLVNDIPADRFEYSYNNKFKPKDKKKIYALIDDCSISGHSIQNFLPLIFNSLYCNANYDSNVVIAPIYCNDFAKNEIDVTLSHYARQKLDTIIKQNPSKKLWSDNIKNEDRLIKSLGEPLYQGDNKDEYPCVIFPYMSPDNNSEIASNIALFHSPFYSSNPDARYQDIQHTIKSYSYNAQKITNLAKELLNETN